MKKINFLTKLILSAYRFKTPETSLRLKGRSPLDIPPRTVLVALFGAIIISIFLGNITLNFLNQASIYHLKNYVEKASLVEQERNSYTIVDLLIPKWMKKFVNANDATIKQQLEESFEGGVVNCKNLAKYISKNSKDNEVTEEEVKNLVVGEMKYTFIFPSRKRLPADKIANQFGLSKNFQEEFANENWSRSITISAIQFLRDGLDEQIFYPSRTIKALDGPIQWITFIIAIWGLLLLNLFRRRWSNLQSYLVEKGHLPWHPSEENVWDLDNAYYKKIDDPRFSKEADPLLRSYHGIFLVPRLIKEVNNILLNSKEVSIYEVIRERIESYRERVDNGEYETINFILWAVPTFGFMGTIFGIISSMESAAAIFTAANNVEQAIALDKVSGALGTAFDTSFIALFLLIFLSFSLARSRKEEANLFEELEYEAIGRLPDQFKES